VNAIPKKDWVALVVEMNIFSLVNLSKVCGFLKI